MEKLNGHELVSGQELTDQKINALKELSDVRFKASETAVNAALATQEKAVAAAFVASEKAVNTAFVTSEKALMAALQASEKAISKAESSQAEINRTIGDLTKDVISLRESRSQGSGKDSAKTVDKLQSNWVTGLAVSILLAVLAIAYHMFK